MLEIGSVIDGKYKVLSEVERIFIQMLFLMFIKITLEREFSQEKAYMI